MTRDAPGFDIRFTLRQLAYFVAAGEAGSVKLASARLNISQPSISAAIGQLEAELNLQLFVRHHAQGLSLTPAGAQMLQAAKRLLQQAGDLHAVAEEASTAISGTLDLGAFRTFAPLLAPELCKTFLDQHPNVRLRVVEGDEADLMDKLKRAEIALAITYQLNLTDEIAFEPLANLPTHILLPADHRLADRGALALAELADEDFIMLDMPLTREYFLSLFMREGVTPRITTRSPHPETVRSYVASGFGWSLATARPASKIAVNGRPLAYVPLKGDHPPVILGLATLKGLRKTRALEAFEAHCRALVMTATLPGMAAWAGQKG